MSAARQRPLPGRMERDTEGLEQLAQPNLSRERPILHSAGGIVSDIFFLLGLHKVIAILCCLPASLACFGDSVFRKEDCKALAYAVCNPVTWIVWSLTGIIALLFLPRRRPLYRLFAFAGVVLCTYTLLEFVRELVLGALDRGSTMGNERTQL